MGIARLQNQHHELHGHCATLEPQRQHRDLSFQRRQVIAMSKAPNGIDSAKTGGLGRCPEIWTASVKKGISAKVDAFLILVIHTYIHIYMDIQGFQIWGPYQGP